MTPSEIERRLRDLKRPLAVENVLAGGERPLPSVVVETRDPFAEWQWFRERAGALGCWPVLLSNDAQMARLLEEGVEDAPPVAGILAKAAEIRDEAAALRILEAPYDAYRTPGEPFVEAEVLGTWPAHERPNTEFQTLRSGGTRLRRTGQGFLDRLLHRTPPGHRFGLIPAAHPWEIFAWLNFGDWNDCPAAHAHVALHRLWHERWGAEPVILAHDTLECRVLNPPETREDAMALAELQYRYCSDIVSQGVGTVAELAATLRRGTVWYFWWD